jgi:hypothetical protein
MHLVIHTNHVVSFNVLTDISIEDTNTDADKSPLAPLTVPKNQWRPKTPSVWETDEINYDPDFDYIFQDCTGRSAIPRILRFLAIVPEFRIISQSCTDLSALAQNHVTIIIGSE